MYRGSPEAHGIRIPFVPQADGCAQDSRPYHKKYVSGSLLMTSLSGVAIGGSSIYSQMRPKVCPWTRVLSLVAFVWLPVTLVLPTRNHRIPRIPAMSGASAAAQWPSAVLWDIDGTLVNSTDLAWSSTNLVLKQNGFGAVSEEEYRKATRLTTPKRLAFHATKDVDAEIGLKMAEEFDNHYVQLVSPTTVPFFPGLQALLEELAKEGVVLGALSNACGAYVRAVLRAHGFAEAFRTQLGADDVAEAKPAPAGLLKCCEILALCPDRRVCYVGDSAGDGKAAKAAGLYSASRSEIHRNS